jgi:hypothetical protein
MTEWADPIKNPKQNAKYWREQHCGVWIKVWILAAIYTAVLGAVWLSAQMVGGGTGRHSSMATVEREHKEPTQ